MSNQLFEVEPAQQLSTYAVTRAAIDPVVVAELYRMKQLLAQVPVGDEIPRDLYVAVARVLAFVYALTGKVPGQD